MAGLLALIDRETQRAWLLNSLRRGRETAGKSVTAGDSVTAGSLKAEVSHKLSFLSGSSPHTHTRPAPPDFVAPS